MCIARADQAVIHAYHMAKRLTEMVPVRVSRRQKIALRRMAREAGVDVSEIVRRMIDERSSSPPDRVNAVAVGVAA